MMTFRCEKCNFCFESVGEREEYISPTYGPCFKYVARCPACDNICNEHRINLKKSDKGSCGCSNCSCGS